MNPAYVRASWVIADSKNWDYQNTLWRVWFVKHNGLWYRGTAERTGGGRFLVNLDESVSEKEVNQTVADLSLFLVAVPPHSHE